MPQPATVPPARRPDLVLKPIGNDGRHVAKDPTTGAFYELGPAESFLLLSLDGRQSAGAICAAFAARFDTPLAPEDLDEFLELARAQGLLRSDDGPSPGGEGFAKPDAAAAPPPRPRQSLLYWRRTLFDPDRFLGWLEPWVRFLWTRGFLVASAAAIVAAAWLVFAERQALVTQFPHALRWQTVALAWLTIIAATACHEFAHGLTCKHYGGEVREIGFLLMYGFPCFFCNVSDAWLFRERSKRLWVTLAGGYCDLVLWAAAVFAWRLTLPDSLPNYVAWVVLSVCGVRVFFNFNPLLKLDGYYLMSDWLEMPNLRQRAWEAWLGHVRWALWGAPRPGPQPRGRLLLGFGAASWAYCLFITALVLTGFGGLLANRGGILGIGWTALLGLAMVRGQFAGFTAGEFRAMLRSRRRRAVGWVAALAALVTALAIVRVEDRVGGEFQVRPVRRAEVRAPIAGFLRAVDCDEGDRVSPGRVVARLEVPDLASRIAQKQAEVDEAEARLRLLRVGPRPEEVDAQRARVRRAEAWCALGRGDLEQVREALREELTQLDEACAEARAEHEAAAEAAERARRLNSRGALPAEERREAETALRVARARLGQAEARRQSRAASGALEAEAELALREQKLAEAKAELALLEAGTRPEEIDAERARLARLREEARYLQGLRDRVEVATPLGGLVATPRLRERVGQYLREGELICEVEAPGGLEAEVAVAEQDGARVRPGQAVELKARARPFVTFRGRVERAAPGPRRPTRRTRRRP